MVFRLGNYWVVALCVALSSCTTTEVTTYQRVPGSRVAEAYSQPGADFSRYTRLYAHPLEIYYREGESAPTPENLERMRSIFRAAFLAELNGEYEIVTAPAKNALGVRASLVNLQNAPAGEELPVGGRLRALVANGQLTFLMEMSDSLSGEVLARAADPQPPVSDAQGDRATADWTQAEVAAKYWAGLFRDFLDENLGKPGSE